jgi:hypothetical protein
MSELYTYIFTKYFIIQHISISQKVVVGSDTLKAKTAEAADAFDRKFQAMRSEAARR